MNHEFIIFLLISGLSFLHFQTKQTEKPRILISTDIGGTDPDDNQSMAHLLMYSDKLHIEGLISSPSYGNGSKAEILRMIDLYEKDLPKLKKNREDFPAPDYLRSITKQGQSGNAPYQGYRQSTEGSDWIIACAKKESTQPLWVLVWGGLEDLAQALHDAPEIQDKIRIYWIGGPNKKWSANSYAYIAEHFPNLWFIEVNSSYYGFFSENDAIDVVKNSDYYARYIDGAGYLGKDFKNYYKGEIKMGDTPSLLYLLNGDPNDPLAESWGGSFENITYSPRMIFEGPSTLEDTLAFATTIEFHLEGPDLDISADSSCFLLEVPYGANSVQKWPGYYLGNYQYAVRYVPKQAEILSYKFTSSLPAINDQQGQIVVDNLWPGRKNITDYPLGNQWYSDKSGATYYDGKIQGGKTISKWKNEALMDWAERWNWLKE